MPEPYRFLISGGGTGGHIFPAISIADELRRRHPDCAIHFVGASDRMEMQRIPDAGYNITGLWIKGIDRKRPLSNWRFPFQMVSSLIRSHLLIGRYKPDAVIGTGGFASGPLLLAAKQRSIPILIQEQNSFPGITNRWLSSKARSICVAYEGLERFFPKERTIHTGNPIRKDLLRSESSREACLKSFGLNDRPTILVLGGSQGARAINHALRDAYLQWLEEGFNVIWQTGQLYIDALKKEIQPADGLWMDAFISRMPEALKCADLVISRAGAGTISELEVLGKAALLIPSPNVAEDHQTHNAQTLVRDAAALMIAESDLSSALVTTVLELMKDERKRQDLEKNALERGRPDATEQIVNAIETMIER
jgi:UDP-N-acetylglucosamine--N-acetylmuramyl-(pentapeptide) pyrophosphoryl-undecaprenol N-acetylglucosamine transferase